MPPVTCPSHFHVCYKTSTSLFVWRRRFFRDHTHRPIPSPMNQPQKGARQANRFTSTDKPSSTMPTLAAHDPSLVDGHRRRDGRLVLFLLLRRVPSRVLPALLHPGRRLQRLAVHARLRHLVHRNRGLGGPEERRLGQGDVPGRHRRGPVQEARTGRQGGERGRRGALWQGLGFAVNFPWRGSF